jgi:hypothetical protein
MNKKKIRITRKQARILNYIFTVVYLLLAFWVDWRVGIIFILYDISVVLEIFGKQGGKA